MGLLLTVLQQKLTLIIVPAFLSFMH